MIEGLRFVYTSAEVADALTARAIQHEKDAPEAIRRGNEHALKAADEKFPESAEDIREQAQRDHDLHLEAAADYRDLAAHVPPGETFALPEGLRDYIGGLAARMWS